MQHKMVVLVLIPPLVLIMVLKLKNYLACHCQFCKWCLRQVVLFSLAMTVSIFSPFTSSSFFHRTSKQQLPKCDSSGYICLQQAYADDVLFFYTNLCCSLQFNRCHHCTVYIHVNNKSLLHPWNPTVCSRHYGKPSL